MRSLAWLGFLIVGCSSCGPSGPAVPFGLDEPGSDEPPVDSVESRPNERPNEARTFPHGTTQVNIEGAPLEESGSIRALLARDLDGDGDRDVIAVVGGPARVVFWRREGSAFEPARVLGTAPTAEGCEIGDATLSPLTTSWLIARAEITCAESPADARVDQWVLDTDRTPRTLEHFAVLGSDDPDATPVTVTLASDDRDEDGRDDLTVRVNVGASDESPGIVLTWLDRPSGLARDAAEPEAAFSERSRDALRRLRRTSRQALLRSQHVLALHEAICREPGRARFLVGSVAGLSCGDSDGAGRAATTIVRAHAADGHTLEALEALERMERPGLHINDERRTYARRALANAPATSDVHLREGPRLDVPAGSVARLSALGFLDENRVLLRGSPPTIWHIDTDETRPAERGDRRVRDASGRFEVVEVGRTCDGYVLRISANGMPATTPLLSPLDPPTGTECPLDGPLSRDSGGWALLGWAPQGVLASHGTELRIVPLDISGRSAGSPRSLEPGTSAPAPLPPGAISHDGRNLVLLRGPGVLLHRVLTDEEPELLWPEGWGELEGDPTDAAPSPSGHRVAVLRAGRVYLIERGQAEPQLRGHSDGATVTGPQ